MKAAAGGPHATLVRASPVVAIVVFAALAHPLCNLIFRCGCDWLGPAHCNVHHMMGPRCPWCALPAHRLLAAVGILIGGITAFVLVRAKRPDGYVATFAATLAGCIAGALAAAGASVAITGYPHFLLY